MSFTIIPGSSNNFLKQAIISRPSILRCGLCSCTNVSKFLDTTCKVLAMLVYFKKYFLVPTGETLSGYRISGNPIA